MSRLNSVVVRTIVAACGVEIEFECVYTGRNWVDMENQVETLIINSRIYVLCSIFKVLS